MRVDERWSRRSPVRRWTVVLCLAIAAGPASAQAFKKRPDVTGTWRGTVDIAGRARPVTLQLHQRAGGDVLGLVLGGTSYRTVTRGRVSGAVVELGLELRDPELTRSFALSGGMRGRTLVLVTDDGLGAGSQTVVLTRTEAVLHERRFVFTTSLETPPYELAVVQDGAGRFVSGGFVSQDGCRPLGCGGGLTSFVEDPSTGRVRVGIETAGTCGITGSFEAEFVATARWYRGTYAFTSCRGDTAAGPIVGARGMATRSDHAASALATYGRLADDLEARVAFTASHPSFSPSYLHYGEGLDVRLAELNAQVAANAALRVELARFRNLATVVPAGVHPWAATALGLVFHDRRARVAGGVATVLRDVDTDVFHDELSLLGEVRGEWVIAGNGDREPPGLVLPIVPSEMVRPSDVVNPPGGIWPYGVHAGGHPRGHPGIDFDLVAGGKVLAMRGGTVSAVESDPGGGGTASVFIDTASFQLEYDHLDASTVPSVGDTVAQGEFIGSAATGGAWATFHVQVGPPEKSVCPWDLMRPEPQLELEALFLDAAYDGDLVEPFLCNDPDRNRDAFPLVTRWDLSTPGTGGALAAIRFSRASAGQRDETTYAYDWVDPDGVATASGVATTNRVDGTIDFHQVLPVAATYLGRFTVQGAPRTATLLLDVGDSSGPRPPDLAAARAYTASVEQ